MSRARLVVLLAAAGVLVAGLPATAAPDEEARALALLTRAAHAAAGRSWSGTQYVGTWRGPAQTSAVVEVSHRPGSGSAVRTAGGAGEPVVVPELDARLLSLLADSYALAVTGLARCAGRPAQVVAARRADGSVAGRFWLDRATGLVLRREVYDSSGARLTSSAFVDVQVGAAPSPAPAHVAGRPAVEPVATGGWRAPRALPGGLRLFDVRQRAHEGGAVLQLAYSDGLSTMSVFAQRGRLPEHPAHGYARRRVAGTPAYVQPAAPERVVWQGDGHVFTLVSDAEPGRVAAAVAALPRDPAPRPGLLGRLGRGLSRLGSWLNPFA